MAQTNYTPIQLYRSTTAAAVPSAGNMAAGELAINTTDGKLFYKDTGGTVKSFGGGATGGGNDQTFYLNGQTVTTNYTIPAGQNAGTFGPITVAVGATVTVSSGSTWTVT
jgi:hypothetical protein